MTLRRRILALKALLVANALVLLLLVLRYDVLVREYGYLATWLVVAGFSYSGVMGSQHVLALQRAANR